MKNNGDKSAFPAQREESIRADRLMPGLTKREWFAGRALSGLLSRSSSESDKKNLAVVSVQMADLLLAALEVK